VKKIRLTIEAEVPNSIANAILSFGTITINGRKRTITVNDVKLNDRLCKVSVTDMTSSGFTQSAGQR
jgi:hypothetical protein